MNINELISFREEFIALSPAQFRARVQGYASLQKRVEKLYNAFFPDMPKLNKGCGNCWEDAYIVLRASKIEKVMANLNRQYNLVGGVVLVSDNPAKMCNRHTLTDELAEYHLRRDPSLIRFFDRYPADWQKRISRNPKNTAKNEGKNASKQSNKPEAEKPEKEAKNEE